MNGNLNMQSAYHKWLLKQRIWCEHGERRGIPCMAVATTVRQINGRDTVLCDWHGRSLSALRSKRKEQHA